MLLKSKASFISVQNSNGFENIPPIGYNLDNMKLLQIHTKSTEYHRKSAFCRKKWACN